MWTHQPSQLIGGGTLEGARPTTLPVERKGGVLIGTNVPAVHTHGRRATVHSLNRQATSYLASTAVTLHIAKDFRDTEWFYMYNDGDTACSRNSMARAGWRHVPDMHVEESADGPTSVTVHTPDPGGTTQPVCHPTSMVGSHNAGHPGKPASKFRT